jgi:hypothetical protein
LVCNSGSSHTSLMLYFIQTRIYFKGRLSSTGSTLLIPQGLTLCRHRTTSQTGFQHQHHRYHQNTHRSSRPALCFHRHLIAFTPPFPWFLSPCLLTRRSERQRPLWSRRPFPFSEATSRCHSRSASSFNRSVSTQARSSTFPPRAHHPNTLLFQDVSLPVRIRHGSLPRRAGP